MHFFPKKISRDIYKCQPICQSCYKLATELLWYPYLRMDHFYALQRKTRLVSSTHTCCSWALLYVESSVLRDHLCQAWICSHETWSWRQLQNLIIWGFKGLKSTDSLVCQACDFQTWKKWTCHFGLAQTQQQQRKFPFFNSQVTVSNIHLLTNRKRKRAEDLL